MKGNELLGALSCCNSLLVVPKSLLVSRTHLPCDFCKESLLRGTQGVPVSLFLLHSVPAAEPLGTWSSTGKPLPWQPGEGGAALKPGNLALILVPHSSYHTKLISHEKQTWKGLSAVTAVTSEQGEENMSLLKAVKCLHWLLVGARVSVSLFPFPSPWLHSPH